MLAVVSFVKWTTEAVGGVLCTALRFSERGLRADEGSRAVFY